MRPPIHFSFLLLLQFILFFAASVSALPVSGRAVAHGIARRQQGAITEPTTVQTTQMSNTTLGPMLEACTVKLTPITLDNGESAVEMVKNCTLSLVNPGNGTDPLPFAPPPATTISLDSYPSPSSSVSTSPSSSESPSSSSATAITTTTASDTSSTSAPAPTDPPPPATDPVQDPAPAAPTSTEAVAPGANAGTTASAGASTIILGGGAASSTGSGVPVGGLVSGKKLSVLPIGLGVFAGITVIALIVVGLVTYERTKYRKIFRQRKRAEALLDFSSRR